MRSSVACLWLFGGTLLGFGACSGDSSNAPDDDDGSSCQDRVDCAGSAGEASGGTDASGGTAGRGQGGSGGTDEGGSGGEAAASGGTSGGGGGATGGTGGSRGGSGGVGGATGGTGGSSGGSSGAGGSSGGTGGSSGGTAGSTAGASTGGSAGASAGTTSTAGTSGECSSCIPGPFADPLLIQNFENNSSLVLAHGSRNGSFLTYVTGTSTVDPLEDVEMTPECTGVNGNCYRLCASGAVSGTDYPVAAIAVDLAGMTPYDLSAYSGIAFDLSGQIGNGTRLDFHVSTVGTTDVMYGGSCTPGTLRCQDHYSITTSLSPQTVSFSSLSQAGWGVGAAWNAAQVLEIHWQVTSIASTASSQAFTICIDDVMLVE